jgi:hypothetical protein
VKAFEPRKEKTMKTLQIFLAAFFLFLSTSAAQADFQYTETSQVTGGALIGAVKFASVFARGDAKKQERQMLQPTTTTHYLKGDRLRTDHADGTAQIIDLDGRRVIAIDMNKKTYAVATFEEIRAAFEQMEQRIQQQPQGNSQQKPQPQDAQVKITPTIRVTPGAGNRVILNQPTSETKVQMDLAMQASATAGADAPPPGQPSAVTATYTMNMDTFVAPDVRGYREFAQFYRRMAEEVNWMKLPAMNVQIDPRVAQGMSELQRNSDALKGFPLLSYVSMTLTATDANGQPLSSGSQNDAQNQQTQNPPPAKSSTSSDNSIPDSPSAAVMKGLGGLFGKKKNNASTTSNQDTSGAGQSSPPPPNPDSNPNALIEITTQVTSFSESSLDGGLFDIPAGYAQVQEDAGEVYSGVQSRQQPPRK